ncbi:MAG: ParB/RepB/Spo0J family partition protein, partial [Pirellulaceae bacterium]|nr:ParB/RepB/Spo0J family partition protein [Pirellulaceae bacterium]
MSKEKRLGKGLAALLGATEDSAKAEPEAAPEVLQFPHGETSQGSTPPAAAVTGSNQSDGPPSSPTSTSSPASANEPPDNDFLHLSVHDIDDNPFQPRRDFSETEIASLSESLKEHDMLQPVLVRQVAGRYQLISGERRLRAAIQAGWQTIPARLRVADDRLVAELAIVENLQRKDLNPVEKALSFKRYLDEHECTQEDLARRLKIDRSSIANLMRLLELPDEILGNLRRGELSAGH